MSPRRWSKKPSCLSSSKALEKSLKAAEATKGPWKGMEKQPEMIQQAFHDFFCAPANMHQPATILLDRNIWSHQIVPMAQGGLKLLRVTSLTQHPELHGELLCAKAQARCKGQVVWFWFAGKKHETPLEACVVRTSDV